MMLQRLYTIVCLTLLIILTGSCNEQPEPSESALPTAQTQEFRYLGDGLGDDDPYNNPAAVTAGVFSPDGKWAFTGDVDGVVRLWDVETGKEIRRYGDVGHEDSNRADELVDELGVIGRVVSSPDGRFVLAGGGGVRAWHVDTGEEAWRADGYGILSMRFSPDGMRVLVTCRNGCAKLLDAATGRELLRLEGYKSDGTTELDDNPYNHYVWDAAFSPDGLRVLTAEQDGHAGCARLWDVASGQELRRFDHEREVTNCAFLSNGAQVLTISGYGAAQLWDVESGAEITDRPWTGRAGWYRLSPDRSRILIIRSEEISPGRDETGYLFAASLWDIYSDRKLSEFVSPTFSGHYTFSCDGNRVLTFDWHRCAEDRSLRLWDVYTGKVIRTLDGHTWQVAGAVFSPEGKHVLSFEKDSGIAIIWATSEQ